MRTVSADLEEGLKIGDAVHTHAVIRAATAADLIDATEESEKLIMTPDGPALVASPSMVGVNTLRRQIVKIGEYEGPLTLKEMRKLSAVDFSLLQEKADELETAALKGAADRGRSDAGGENAD